jgi:single-strand DNA-binding protein
MEIHLLRISLIVSIVATRRMNAFSPIHSLSLRESSVFIEKIPSPLSVGNFFDEIEPFPDEDDLGDSGYLSDEELDAAAGEWDPSIPQFNRITLTGRVGNDPDPRYFDNGKVVLNLSLAVKRKYDGYERQEKKIKSGEEETDWFGLEIWGRDAEYAAKFVTKGGRIGVTGNLQVDYWEDKMTGERRQRVKVIVKDLDILETRAEAELRRGGGASFDKNNHDSDDNEDEDGLRESWSTRGGFFD